MARMRSDLPRMQKQAPARAPRPAPIAPESTVEKPVAARKPPMMRQYDLIERVRRYNPDTNEALLNRAYVYAMKAHGEQRRASGDPYFSIRSRSRPFSPTSSLTTRRSRQPSCTTPLRIPRPRVQKSTACSVTTSAGWSRGSPSSKNSTSSPKRQSRRKISANCCWRSPLTCACF